MISMRLLTALFVLVCVAPARADGPFVALDVKAASAKAKAENKLLLMAMKYKSSPSCKQMHDVIWPDATVGKWIEEHAVAIEIDLDAAPLPANSVPADALPAVILLRDGHELDRHAGFSSAADFIAWGDAVLAGHSTASLLLQSDDVDARYKAAIEAMQRADYDAALQHFLWLWPHTRSVMKYFGVRVTFMLDQMARLAQVHEPAQKAFAEILDDLQRKIDAATVPDFMDWEEWRAMCRSFHEPGRILAWYEARCDKRGQLFADNAKDDLVVNMTDEVFDRLVEAGRTLDAGRLYVSLTDRADRDLEHYESGLAVLSTEPAATRDQTRDDLTSTCREDLATLHAIALAANRPGQAGRIAEQLLSVLDDADSRIALVTRALDLATARPPQLARWLDEAAVKGASVSQLRARLVQPLAPAPK